MRQTGLSERNAARRDRAPLSVLARVSVACPLAVASRLGHQHPLLRAPAWLFSRPASSWLLRTPDAAVCGAASRSPGRVPQETGRGCGGRLGETSRCPYPAPRTRLINLPGSAAPLPQIEFFIGVRHAGNLPGVPASVRVFGRTAGRGRAVRDRRCTALQEPHAVSEVVISSKNGNKRRTERT
jgi:hypothetical protein